MTHRKRTLVLVLAVAYAGFSYPYVDVAVSRETYDGLYSDDWEFRARKFAGLAKQVKAKLTAKGYNMEGKFLSEKDITIVQVRPVKGAPPIEDQPF